MKNIIIAKHAGTCFGVDNAIKTALEAVKRTKGKNIFIKGDLVHNPLIMSDLENKGLRKTNDETELKEGDNLIIRAHGEPVSVYNYCKKNNIEIIDCTCPFVKRSQILARELESEGYRVLLIGKDDHPEIRGIAAQIKNPLIYSDPSVVDLEEIRKQKKIGILSQTTQNIQNFKAIILKIVDETKDLKIYNTICNATSNRQKAAIELCKTVDMVVVIGGKNSDNTKRLYEICSEHIKAYWITEKDELNQGWFKGVNNIGITAGASTPKYLIDEIVDEIKKI